MKRKSKQDTLFGLGATSAPPKPGSYSPLNPSVLIVPALGPHKEPFEPEPATDRDTILRTALAYLEGRGVEYVPLALEEDIQTSYDDDTYDEFRATVKGWVRALLETRAA